MVSHVELIGQDLMRIAIVSRTFIPLVALFWIRSKLISLDFTGLNYFYLYAFK